MNYLKSQKKALKRAFKLNNKEFIIFNTKKIILLIIIFFIQNLFAVENYATEKIINKNISYEYEADNNENSLSLESINQGKSTTESNNFVSDEDFLNKKTSTNNKNYRKTILIFLFCIFSLIILFLLLMRYLRER